MFVLTGAGISAESGLGTFRYPNGQGIWARFDPMKLASLTLVTQNIDDLHERVGSARVVHYMANS